jgi:hypothetical protein
MAAVGPQQPITNLQDHVFFQASVRATVLLDSDSDGFRRR